MQTFEGSICMESNTYGNIALIRALAIDTFGSKSVAESWLNTYNDSLGAAPIDVVQTFSGFLDAQKVLSAINYGGAV